MEVRFSESSALNIMAQTALNETLWDFKPIDLERMTNVFCHAMPSYLALRKDKDKKVAVRINDDKGNLIIAGIVSYEKTEDETMPGAWEYYLTTDEKELEDAKVVIGNSDLTFHEMIRMHAGRMYRMGFKADEPLAIPRMLGVVFTSIFTWLDQNAKADEVVKLENPGVFIASVAIENGEKVMAITPDGENKRIVKDDLASSQDIAV